MQKQHAGRWSVRENSEWFQKGFRVGIPICLGYFAVSFALGITARDAGLSAFQSGVMSLGMLASAGEFAAITLISAGAGALEMITTTIIVNLRYFLMGCALSQKVDEKTPVIHRFLLSWCITDEIFGICASQEGKLNPFFAYGAAIIAAAGWTCGTILGVILGNILPGYLVNALSVALYGMFLAVIIPASRKNLFLGLIVVLSMTASFLFDRAPLLNSISMGFRVILLTLLIAGAAALSRPIEEKGENT